jgi:6-phosphofructokinase 1
MYWGEGKMSARKVALLTGGGDSSAINDFIRTLTILLSKAGIVVLGVNNSYRGLIEKDFTELNIGKVDGIYGSGGTVIGTSRTNPYKLEGAVEKILKNIDDENIDVLVCAGGNDTLTVASKLTSEGINTIGVPQTIDNDILGTDYSIGFHSAVKNIVETTMMMISSNIAHEKEMLVEVMGRDSGFLAVRSALILGADAVLIPEFKVDLDRICRLVEKKRKKGKKHGLYIVSEGVEIEEGELLQNDVDVFGNVKLGGIVYALADMIDKKIGIKPRVNVAGYIQRGGIPAAYDTYQSSIFARGVLGNIESNKFGVMVGTVGEKPQNIALKDAISELKVVDRKTYEFVNYLGDIW